jgi:hypothetical protein
MCHRAEVSCRPMCDLLTLRLPLLQDVCLLPDVDQQRVHVGVCQQRVHVGVCQHSFYCVCQR